MFKIKFGLIILMIGMNLAVIGQKQDEGFSNNTVDQAAEAMRDSDVLQKDYTIMAQWIRLGKLLAIAGLVISTTATIIKIATNRAKILDVIITLGIALICYSIFF